MEKCTWVWTIQNGVDGFVVTSRVEGYKNKSIFLPVVEIDDHSISLSYSMYWSNELYDFDELYGVYTGSALYFDENNIGYDDYFDCYCGFPVRPVCP